MQKKIRNISLILLGSMLYVQAHAVSLIINAIELAVCAGTNGAVCPSYTAVAPQSYKPHTPQGLIKAAKPDGKTYTVDLNDLGICTIVLDKPAPQKANMTNPTVISGNLDTGSNCETVPIYGTYDYKTDGSLVHLLGIYRSSDVDSKGLIYKKNYTFSAS